MNLKHLYCSSKLRFALIIVCMIVPFSLYGQNKERLSSEGVKHWKAAEALLESASNTSELISVTSEFEQVLITDPDYADAFFNLGRLYSKIGKEKGDKYFDKAKEAFNRYLLLRPNDTQLIDEELYIVDALRKSTEKSRSENAKKSFGGTWKCTNSEFPLYFIIDDANGSFRITIKSIYSNDWVQIADYVDYRNGSLTFSYTTTEYRNGSTWRESTSTWSVTCDKEVSTDKYILSLNGDAISAYNEQNDLYYLRGSLVDHTKNTNTLSFYK